MIKLYNELTVSSPYIGKSKISFWNDLEVGDVIKLSIRIGYHYRRSTPHITLTNTRTNEKISVGFNEFNQRLNKFGSTVHEA